MYAIVSISGKQYRVAKGDKVRVDLLGQPQAEQAAGFTPGSTLELKDVLLIGGDGATKVGQPNVAGASVTASIVKHARGTKLWAFKRKRRKGFHKIRGHRQWFTELEITGIKG